MLPLRLALELMRTTAWRPKAKCHMLRAISTYFWQLLSMDNTRRPIVFHSIPLRCVVFACQLSHGPSRVLSFNCHLNSNFTTIPIGWPTRPGQAKPFHKWPNLNRIQIDTRMRYGQHTSSRTRTSARTWPNWHFNGISISSVLVFRLFALIFQSIFSSIIIISNWFNFLFLYFFWACALCFAYLSSSWQWT